MKKCILILAMLGIQAQAGVTTTIAQLVEPSADNENYEVFANNGRVYEVSPANEESIRSLYEAKAKESSVNLEVEEGVPFNPELVELVHSVKLEAEFDSESAEEDSETDIDKNANDENANFLTPMTGYEPSDLESLDLVKDMFKSLKKRTKWFSQCYNRAHIWARQMHKDYGVKSQKILIYYTKKYRREVDKKWWFHIAPMVSVQGEKYVLDKEFTSAPVTDQEWEEIFTKKMRSGNIGPRDYRCSKIVNISEYYDDVNTQNEYCNIQHVSMYYWNPVNLSALEKNGVQMTKWDNSYLKTSAKGIFWRWRKVYKEYKIQ